MKENITILRNKFIPSTLVNYQDGAIVSRTLIEKPEGTVTLFAFDKGQKLSEHTAPFDALVQILEVMVRSPLPAKNSIYPQEKRL